MLEVGETVAFGFGQMAVLHDRQCEKPLKRLPRTLCPGAPR